MSLIETVLKMIYRMLNNSLQVANRNITASIRNRRHQVLFVVKLIALDFVCNNRPISLYPINLCRIREKIDTFISSACNHFIHLI